MLQGLTAAQASAGQQAAAVATLKALAPSEGLGEVEVQLLLGKTYAAWQGHVGDALEVYDRLIESRPEEFRGYLAKGLLLKANGRLADAERSFIQAKFHAAPEQRPVVDALIAK